LVQRIERRGKKRTRPEWNGSFAQKLRWIISLWRFSRCPCRGP
jgi:hypothetical protein